VQVHLSGAFPRSESLIEMTRSADRGRAFDADVASSFEHDYHALVQLEAQAALDYVIDGQLNWQDLFRPFSELFTGIQLGSLTRWFDNNTFYRKPIVVEKIGFVGKSVDKFFQHGLLPKSQPKKAIVPGPLTFALLSEDKIYGNLADLIDDTSHALRDLIAYLGRAGYVLFQFNEPAITGSMAKNAIDRAKQAYAICAKVAGAKTSLHTYFADPGPLLDIILDLPVDSIGIDFYATSAESIAEHTFTREIDCGCIDGRNSLLETPRETADFVRRVQERVEPKGITVCPNCDLDFLPYPVAERKTSLLTEVKKELN
jgi:5-methyltetrahydropteroyltriglutamate--homocysteine methyltransferase